MKHVAMHLCHITQWHDRSKRSEKAGMPFRTTSVQDEPTWRTTQFNSLLSCSMLVAYELNMRYQRKSKYVTKLCSTFCTTFWVIANLQRVGYLMKFPMCNNGLVGPVAKGKWRLSWINRRCGRNLGSLIRTTLETPIKWMEASRFSSSRESALYTMCCEGDAHCGVWHGWGNTAPLFIFKANGKRCLLLHVPAVSHSCSAQEKTTTLGGTELHYSSWQCKESHLWHWEILEHPPYSPNMCPCDYDLFANVKEPLWWNRYNTSEHAIEGQYGTSTMMDALMVYDAFQTFGKRW